MTIIKRLPVYAAGLGFTVLLVVIAAGRDWSGVRTLVVALGVAAFYVVTILVPWFIREQVGRESVRWLGMRHLGSHTNGGRATIAVGYGRETDGVLIAVDVEEGTLVPATHGPVTLSPSEPHTAHGR
jgi:hypothetical protein